MRLCGISLVAVVAACAGPAGVRPCAGLSAVRGETTTTGPEAPLDRAAELSREWNELDGKATLLRMMLHDLEAARWPFPPDVAAEERATWLDSLVRTAAAQAGIELELVRVDCTEHPCVAFGEVSGRELLDRLIEADAVRAARRGASMSIMFAAAESVRRNVWRGTKRAGFGLAFYEEGPATEILEWRLRERADAFWEEEQEVVRPPVPATPADASALAEDLLGVLANQRILEMALVESTDPVWAFPEIERYRPEAVLAAVNSAIRDTGASAVVTYADCREYPCMLYGEVGEEWYLERILAANAIEPYLSTGRRWLSVRPADQVVTRGGERCVVRYFTLALYLTSDRELMVRRIAERDQRYWQSRGPVGRDVRRWSD